MDSAIYAACAGLIARTTSLDTIASNLANASSAGFHGQRNVFGTVLAQAAHHHGTLNALNKAMNSFGVLTGTQIDTTQGTLTHTGNDLDLALEGPGYFKVQTPNGIAYTRNGSFQLSSKGVLTTAAGDPVLTEGDRTVTLTHSPATISADGTVSSAGAIVGRLQVVAFASPAALTSRGAGYYTAPADQEVAAVGTGIRQGAIENSNVSPVDGVVDLISAQRSAESMRHVLSMLDGDMDKTAVQDLARVNAA
jgi:flagellar basal-body rod protein FlgF